MTNLAILFSVGIALLLIVGAYFLIEDRKRSKSQPPGADRS
jgi:hypothetical protein